MEFLEGKNNPFDVFIEWFEEAQKLGLKEPTAMTLATASLNSKPSVRTILLKGYDERGFCFYTNFNSKKGQELLSNPQAALLFYWMPQGRQIRIEGVVTEVSPAEADDYFASRRPESRIGAWASHQSKPLSSRVELINRVKEYESKFDEGLGVRGKGLEESNELSKSSRSLVLALSNIPRPPHWSGFRLVPDYFEFWEEGDFRLHNRREYKKNSLSWNSNLMNP